VGVFVVKCQTLHLGVSYELPFVVRTNYDLYKVFPKSHYRVV